MHQPRRLRLTATILLCFALQTLGADKYTDENRPYEFGFKIDGQQHRHESKDKDGIIMGEFGFVTADDVYHVTVYATDKEGRFKILSMKNIHLKSSPASSLGGPTSARQGHALALPPAPANSVVASQQPQRAPQPGRLNKPVSIEKPKGSCSSCSLPTTTTRAPPPSYNQATDNNNYNSLNQFGAPQTDPQNQQVFPPTPYGQQNTAQGGPSGPSYNNQAFSPSPYGQQNTAQGGHSDSLYSPEVDPRNYFTREQNFPQQGPIAPGGSQSYAPQPGVTPQNSPNYSQKPYVPNKYAQPEGGIFASGEQAQGGARLHAGFVQTNSGEGGLFGGNNTPYVGAAPNGPASTGPGAGNFANGNVQQAGPNAQSNLYPKGGERTPKQFNGPRQQFDSQFGPNGPQGPSVLQNQPGPAKPTLTTVQMNIVDKNTDIYSLGPNEQRGLPPGLSQNDISTLLYTFNYTVGFHGHSEEGYTNGVKKGHYFVTGRNGVRTRIDYIADDTGFHPTVTNEILDLLSEDVPKPETEKDEKYGLKHYEFKWLFYPVESKRR